MWLQGTVGNITICICSMSCRTLGIGIRLGHSSTCMPHGTNRMMRRCPRIYGLGKLARTMYDLSWNRDSS